MCAVQEVFAGVTPGGAGRPGSQSLFHILEGASRFSLLRLLKHAGPVSRHIFFLISLPPSPASGALSFPAIFLSWNMPA